MFVAKGILTHHALYTRKRLQYIVTPKGEIHIRIRNNPRYDEQCKGKIHIYERKRTKGIIQARHLYKKGKENKRIYPIL